MDKTRKPIQSETELARWLGQERGYVFSCVRLVALMIAVTVVCRYPSGAVYTAVSAAACLFLVDQIEVYARRRRSFDDHLKDAMAIQLAKIITEKDESQRLTLAEASLASLAEVAALSARAKQLGFPTDLAATSLLMSGITGSSSDTPDSSEAEVD